MMARCCMLPIGWWNLYTSVGRVCCVQPCRPMKAYFHRSTHVDIWFEQPAAPPPSSSPHTHPHTHTADTQERVHKFSTVVLPCALPEIPANTKLMTLIAAIRIRMQKCVRVSLKWMYISCSMVSGCETCRNMHWHDISVSSLAAVHSLFSKNHTQNVHNLFKESIRCCTDINFKC